MVSITKIPQVKRGGSLQPVLPLIPDKVLSAEEEKGKYVSFELKTRVGQPEGGTKYKKYVRKFEEGTPQEWIDLLRDFEEIWTQNSMNGPTDRASTIRALIRGESAIAFEAALQDARSEGEPGDLAAMTVEHIQVALKAVTTEVFPHRALEIQKLWMNRRMFKPAELTTRQTAAAINRLNNSLPLFPDGSENDKFSPQEIIGLIEWSLPPAWRAKFDLDGYVPSLHSKARLIEACEAIERNEQVTKKEQEEKGNNNKKRKGGKTKNASKVEGNSTVVKYFCKEHGYNSSHNTEDCFTLKNRAKKSAKVDVGNDKKRTFSNNALRKELNFLAKGSSKEKILEMYSNVIKKEQAKLKKAAKKKKAPASDSESNDEMSINAIESEPIPKKKKVQFKETLPEEEAEYLKKLNWLKDHGENIDETTNVAYSSSDDE